MHGGYIDFSIQQWINFSADGDIAIAIAFPSFRKWNHSISFIIQKVKTLLCIPQTSGVTPGHQF